MKLFENGVGRPSNEVLRKRKIVTLSIVTGVIAFVAILIGGITLLVSKSNNVDNLKGSANKANVVVLASQRKSIFSWLFDLFDIFIPKKTTITTKPSTTTTTTKTTKTTTITTKAPVANIKETKVLADECGFPYSKSNCSNSKNDTVKQIQTMLQKLGYNAKADGYYGTETESAVKEFQNKYKITPADGVVGYKELTTLAEKTSTTYYNIEYYKDSSVKADSKSGLKGVSLLKENGVEKVKQTIIKGINTKISGTKLQKSGESHQGYYASTYSKDGKKYRFGCYNKNCIISNAHWYSQTDIDEKAKSDKKFYHYLYKTAQSVANTGYMFSGQKVNFTAQYCKTGYYYDRAQSKCITGRKNIFIGDSRTVGMQAALANQEKSKSEWICKSAQGYNWFRDTAINTLNSKIKSNTHYNIYINLGVNDLYQIDSYISKYKEMSRDKKYANCNFIIVSVNPIDNSRSWYVTNSQIVEFNKKMKQNLPNNFTYCNVYDKIKNNFSTTDGLHYTNSTYKNIYNHMLECK